MIGSAAMSMSSLCVVANALRLRFFKSKFITKTNNSHVSTDTEEKEGNDKMEKTFNVEGMMCPRCEAHVVKALSAIDGVESAVASHTENTATVTLTKDVADDILIKAIIDEGYEVK
jgi:copper chaperone CopZ